MSLNKDCEFWDVKKGTVISYYYVLEISNKAFGFGPFATPQDRVHFLSNKHGNPGGWVQFQIDFENLTENLKTLLIEKIPVVGYFEDNDDE